MSSVVCLIFWFTSFCTRQITSFTLIRIAVHHSFNNPDGAVLHAYLYFIMFLHSRLLFVKVFTLCGVISRTVIIVLCRLFYCLTYACYRRFLILGVTVFFSMFYVYITRLFIIVFHGLRACY